MLCCSKFPDADVTTAIVCSCCDLNGLQALKSPAEEYGRILDILSRYAVYHPTVGFSSKRQVRCATKVFQLAGTCAGPVYTLLLPMLTAPASHLSACRTHGVRFPTSWHTG